MSALLKDTPAGEQYVRMGDVELVRKLNAAIGEVDDDKVSDALYWLTGEILERWAPEVEWASTELDYAHDKNRERELQAHAEVIAQRQKARTIYSTANEKAAAVWAGGDDA